VAMRTSELRASSPSFVSPRASLRVSMTAAGGDEAGMGSPYATSAAAGGGSGGGAGSLPSSPLVVPSSGSGAGGSGSFAFRRSSVYRATSDGMDGFSSPTQGGAYMQVCADTCCCRFIVFGRASGGRPGACCSHWQDTWLVKKEQQCL
jgi:hypothetical protein